MRRFCSYTRRETRYRSRERMEQKRQPRKRSAELSNLSRKPKPRTRAKTSRRLQMPRGNLCNLHPMRGRWPYDKKLPLRIVRTDCFIAHELGSKEWKGARHARSAAYL